VGGCVGGCVDFLLFINLYDDHMKFVSMLKKIEILFQHVIEYIDNNK